MFDKLIDVIINFIEDIIPFVFIKEYDRAIRFRTGRFHKTCGPGLVWKIPFFDKVETTTIVTTTISIPTQSVTTSDEKQLVVKSIVKYKIVDIKAFMLNVYDATDAISDTAQGIIKEQITAKTWAECTDNELDNTITKKLRTAVKHWGIEVEKVTLSDIGIIKSLRLFNETVQFT
jgi:regulator of protease activity HflC (stomatin/prohibitin superfamily)